MASQLDQLINEIAILTGLDSDSVKSKFTKEQLDYLLNVSKCDTTTGSAPLASNLEDISCRDSGAPLDSIDQTPPEYTDTAQKVKDSNKCIEAVDEVNKKVKEKQDQYFEHVLILNKLYELKDNLTPLSYYYKERAKEMARILGEFAPILQELKNLTDSIIDIEDNKIPEQNDIISEQNALAYPDTTIISEAESNIADLQNEISELQLSIDEQNLLLLSFNMIWSNV